MEILRLVTARYGEDRVVILSSPSSYFIAETDWRKAPTHQGGFLLDGGVHYTAGLRRLLNIHEGNEICSISAFTALLQDHLPPVDTINATMRLASGISGTYQHSVGTTLKGSEWTIACERGTVSFGDSKVIVTIGDSETRVFVADERTGVPPTVRAWAEALYAAVPCKDLQPEEALADLELVRLDLLCSG